MPPYDSQRHHRQSIRLKGYDYTQPGPYFVTVVTYGRDCILGDILEGEIRLSSAGEIVRREWERLAQRFPHVMLDSYVIMPNHLHGLFIITDDRRGTADSGKILNPSSSRRAPTVDSGDPSGQTLSRRAPTGENFGKPVPGSLPTIIRSYKSATTLRINYLRRTPSVPVWQRNYYEHIIRDEKEMDAIRRYIQDNPAQWELDQENIAY